MPQERLFRVAPDSLVLSANYVHGEGWRLHISHRTSGEQYAESDRTSYSHLTSLELVDVIDSEISRRLLDV